MTKAPTTKPRSVQQAMVSSTFTDLREHRAALMGTSKNSQSQAIHI
jgi:hypothetical protein